MPIDNEPDDCDFDAVEREYGPMSDTASDAEAAHRYRLAQAHKLIRLYGPWI